MKSQEQIAISLAFEYHNGQTRRGGAPYVNHLMFVVDHLQTEDDNHRAIAWLHDILEDTECTPSDLLNAGITPENVRDIETLTKDSREAYGIYIQSIPSRLRDIKIVDMVSNLVDDPSPHQIEKYIRTLHYFADCA